MARIYQQTTNAASHDNAGCSGASAPTGNVTNCAMSSNGTAGTAESTFEIAASQVGRYCYQMESDAGEPDTNDWSPGGDWNVEINFSTGNSQIALRNVYCCRVNSSGTSQETLGSVSTNWTVNTGVYNTNVTCSATTATTGDRIYVVWVFDNIHMHSAQSVGVTPDQQITTTIASATVNVDLTGRTLCHGLTYSYPSTPQDMTGRTTSVPTVRATLDVANELEGRTPSITTTRGVLSQVAAAADVDLTGRTTAGVSSRATLTQPANTVDLTGRTLCHGLTYSVPAVVATPLNLTGRIASTPTSRATLSQVNNNVNLTGRTLCHGLTYSVPAVVATPQNLTARTTSSASTRATLALVDNNVNLTGRTLCHGLTYSFTPSGLVDLTGRIACLSYPGGTEDPDQGGGAAFVNLTARTMGVAGYFNDPNSFINVELTGRTTSITTLQAPLHLDVDLDGRTASITTTRVTLSQVVNDRNLASRTVSITTTRATLSQQTPTFNELTARVLTRTYQRGALMQIQRLQGRTMGRAFTTVTRFISRVPDIPGGRLRGRVVRFEPIGQIPRRIAPGRAAATMSVGKT